MNNKENNFTKLNRKLFDYIKKVEPEMHTDAYLKVLNSFNTDGRMTMHNFSIYKEKGDRSSGYATLDIDLQTEEYINFRVSNYIISDIKMLHIMTTKRWSLTGNVRVLLNSLLRRMPANTQRKKSNCAQSVAFISSQESILF